ncbi:hypothetical protein EDD85DRAFT_797319 [Armillaria nabsnona]|nr:hypothetical protein EDD85DRAFT_797319 [Armillaria nabsnona]
MIDPENRRFWAQLRSKWGSKKLKKATGIMPAGETIDTSVSTSMALGILDNQVLYSAEEIYDMEYGAWDPYLLPNNGEFLAMTANTEDNKDELYIHENIFKDVLSSQFAGAQVLKVVEACIQSGRKMKMQKKIRLLNFKRLFQSSWRREKHVRRDGILPKVAVSNKSDMNAPKELRRRGSVRKMGRGLALRQRRFSGLTSHDPEQLLLGLSKVGEYESRAEDWAYVGICMQRRLLDRQKRLGNKLLEALAPTKQNLKYLERLKAEGQVLRQGNRFLSSRQVTPTYVEDLTVLQKYADGKGIMKKLKNGLKYNVGVVVLDVLLKLNLQFEGGRQKMVLNF